MSNYSIPNSEAGADNVATTIASYTKDVRETIGYTAFKTNATTNTTMATEKIRAKYQNDRWVCCSSTSNKQIGENKSYYSQSSYLLSLSSNNNNSNKRTKKSSLTRNVSSKLVSNSSANHSTKSKVTSSSSTYLSSDSEEDDDEELPWSSSRNDRYRRNCNNVQSLKSSPTNSDQRILQSSISRTSIPSSLSMLQPSVYPCSSSSSLNSLCTSVSTSPIKMSHRASQLILSSNDEDESLFNLSSDDDDDDDYDNDIDDHDIAMIANDFK
jgi:hypothetical protein